METITTTINLSTTPKNKTTSDLYFTAALLSLGAKLESVNKDDPKHMEFTLSPRIMSTGALADLSIPSMDLDAFEAAWINRTLMVNAYDYSEAIRRMKTIVHSK